MASPLDTALLSDAASSIDPATDALADGRREPVAPAAVRVAADACAELLDAAVRLDGEQIRRTAHAVLDRDGRDALVTDVLVPTLHEIGERWQSGHLSVMHEHHASKIVRSTVDEMRRRSVDLTAPSVVLACPPGELHDLPSHMFALMLIERGIRPVVLPANTPMAAVAQAARSTRATASVVTARRERSVLAHLSALERMSAGAPVFVAGPAAESGEPLGALRVLPSDWRQAADIVAARGREVPGGTPRTRNTPVETNTSSVLREADATTEPDAARRSGPSPSADFGDNQSPTRAYPRWRCASSNAASSD